MTFIRIDNQLHFIHGDIEQSLKPYLISEEFYVVCNGHKITENSTCFKHDCVYEVVPRLLGGKGGFGSMLRAIGAQIEKTTNHEACRDLSGRRMRDLNNEKNLREWVAKKAEREKEKEVKKIERLEKRRTIPPHKFDDPDYHVTKALVAENLEDAVYAGLQKANSSMNNTNNKRKLPNQEKSEKKKKSKEWLGIDIDIDDLSDSDDSSNEINSEQSDHKSNDSYDPAESDCQNQKEKSLDRDMIDEKTIHQATDLSSSTCETHQIDDEKQQKNENSNHNISDTGFDKKNEVPLKQNSTPIDLNVVDSYDELLKYDLDSLKITLSSMGLKCGGTLVQRVERLWSVKGLSKHEIDDSLFAKSAKQKNKAKS